MQCNFIHGIYDNRHVGSHDLDIYVTEMTFIIPFTQRLRSLPNKRSYWPPFSFHRASLFSRPVMRHLALGNDEMVGESSTTVRTHSSYRQSGNRSSQCEIINLARSIEDKLSKGEKFFSLELFPSKRCDSEVYESFFLGFNRHCTPLFYALTWQDEPQSDDTVVPLEILRGFPSNTLLHVTANNSKKAEIVKTLNYALSQGKTNVFALRGDNCSGTGDFSYASDLVKFIRNHYYSNFTICVAGYPQMHPESLSKETDLTYLKEKVDAGANFIITQIFFESRVFVDFVKDCRRYGISVPIIPGIFPIPNLKILLRMAKVCKVEIPQRILKELQAIENDEVSVRAYGIALARKLITEIMASGTASGFHLFTLNRASIALDVCQEVFKL